MDKKMKKIHRTKHSLKFSKFSFSFWLTLTLTFSLTLALSSQTIKRLRVYQKNGQVDTVRVADAASLSHSRIDPSGQLHDDYVTLQIEADDSLRQYLLAQLDSLVLPSGRSVVFHGFTVNENENQNENVNENENQNVNEDENENGSRSQRRTWFSGDFPAVGTGNVVFHWHEGDRISLDVGYQSRAEQLTANDTRAEFIFNGVDGFDASEYTVYYPGNTVTISSTQTQIGPNNSEHIAASGDCGTGTATRQSDGSFDFTLNHKAAYLCFLPHIDNLPSAKLTKIMVTAMSYTSPRTIAGTYRLAGSGLYDATATSNVITLDLENADGSKGFFIGHEANANQTCAAYMVIQPQTDNMQMTVSYHITDTLSHIEHVYHQYLKSFKPEQNRVYPVLFNVRDSWFRSVDLGLSANWSATNASATEPSKPGTAYATDDDANAALLFETKVTQWVMPTAAQKQELLDRCTWERGTYNSQQGWLVTGAEPSVEYGRKLRIFIPAADGVTPAQCLESTYRRPVEALMVDLGLPSGTQWACRNLGAGTAEEVGRYYAYGETEDKVYYYTDNYQLNGLYIGSDYDISGLDTDAATVNWGDTWHLPTKAQAEELANSDNCTWTTETIGGISGYKVTSKVNGNSIFLPYCKMFYNGINKTGYDNAITYLTSTQNNSDATYSYFLLCNSSWESGAPFTSASSIYSAQRYYGHVARPVTNLVSFGNHLLDIKTEIPGWSYGDDKATLYGTLSCHEPISEGVTVGFVIGDDSATVDIDHKRWYYEQTLTAAGTFHQQIDVTDNTGHWYRAYVKTADGQYRYGKAEQYGVIMVDLGLSVLWASMNVGADRYSDKGGYYAWGETVEKDYYNTDSYAYYNKRIDTDGSIVDTEYDVAHVVMGGPWRMPTKTEAEELVDLTKCSWTLATRGGQYGYVVTSLVPGYEGNHIFLPMTGYKNQRYYYEPDAYISYSTGTRSDGSYKWTFQCRNDVNWNSKKPLVYAGGGSYHSNTSYCYGYAVRAVARPNVVTADSVMNIRTDSASWHYGATTATLHATLSSTLSLQTAVTVGFIVGDSANIDVKPANRLADYPQTLSSTGSFSQSVSVHDNLGYYYCAYVRVGGQYYYGKVQHYGLEMVDLGLESGTLWANMNVGATTPLEKGEYYAWGETEPAADHNYSLANYKYYQNGQYVEIGSYDADAGANIFSGATYDAATANISQLWSTPTKTQFEELIAGCTVTEETVEGITLWKFTSNANGRFIYLPKSGYMDGTTNKYINNGYSYYMTSTRYANSSFYDLYITSTTSKTITTINKYYGTVVRPVASPQKAESNGRLLTVATEAPMWTFGDAEAVIRGRFASTTPQGSDVSVGFLIGDSETMAPGVAGVTEQPATLQADGTFSATMTVGSDNVGRWYRAFVKVGEQYFLGRGRHYGVEKVDLGLSVIWANMNVGANKPTEIGNYYAWSYTTTGTPYNTTNYPNQSVSGNNITGLSTYDAACNSWSGTWRMPTDTEAGELLDNANCTCQRILVDGQWCFRFTSVANGRYIDVPSAGMMDNTTLKYTNNAYLWTSVYNNSSQPYYIYIPENSNNKSVSNNSRYYGMNIRPVKSKQ